MASSMGNTSYLKTRNGKTFFAKVSKALAMEDNYIRFTDTEDNLYMQSFFEIL